jgi:CheY-like chemotaxis protein
VIEPTRPESVFRVLLVEDDPDHAELVRRGLEDQHAPVEITVLEDGEAALDFLRSVPAADGQRPHLILLDLRLPKMDGLELLREVKSKPELRAIPCVVLSTSDAERDVARAYELHANSYLVKPGDDGRFTELLGQVERYWRTSNRQLAALPAATTIAQ